MKKIGFLSFGHWKRSAHSQTQSAADVLLQSIDLAVEEGAREAVGVALLGRDGPTGRFTRWQNEDIPW